MPLFAPPLNLAKAGAGVLTLSSDGALTLTVPATGTAALLATANLFTAAQTVQGNANGTWLTIESSTSDRITLGYNATGGRLALANSSAVESVVFDLLNATTPRFYLAASGGRFFGAVAGSGGSVFAYDSAGYFGIEGVNSIASIGNNVNDYKFVSWSGGQLAVGNDVYAANGNSMTAPARQVSFYVNNAAWLGLLVKGAASQSGNLQEWQSSAGAVLCTISENGYFTTRKTSAPADAELATGELALWFDSTAGSAKLMIKAKNASGTVVTGSVALA